MKIFLNDQTEYVEVKSDRRGVNLSIKTQDTDHSSIIITARLEGDKLDELIAQLISSKTKSIL